MRAISKFLKNFFEFSKKAKTDRPKHILYRLADIEEDKEGYHIAVIQIVGKGITYKIKPEELLADDKYIEKFSQKDIRALTYLGYLNVNKPKYKVLAKKHSIKLNKMIFALQKKGEKKPLVKTADQISIDEEILASLDQKDAHMVGYITATEHTLLEEKQKQQLKNERLLKNKSDKISQDQ